VGDPDGSKQQWLARHCREVLRSGEPRLDFEQYVTLLWACPSR